MVIVVLTTKMFKMLQNAISLRSTKRMVEQKRRRAVPPRCPGAQGFALTLCEEYSEEKGRSSLPQRLESAGANDTAIRRGRPESTQRFESAAPNRHSDSSRPT